MPAGNDIPGKPIHVSIGVFPAVLAFTPDGKTAYISTTDGTVSLINTATNTPGKPIRPGSAGWRRPPGHAV